MNRVHMTGAALFALALCAVCPSVAWSQTTITGLVTNARGETVKDYAAIAFAQDREKWKITGRYQSIGRPDQDGRFKMSGLTPTDYYIIALDKIDPNQINDPDFLDSIKIRATAITIREGDTRTVDLKVVVP